MRLGFLLRITVFLIVGLTIGVGSARWQIARSASAVASGGGSWKTWADDGRSATDPYSAAHYLLSGRLPPAANQVRIYESDEDDNGALFDGDCVYTISGPAQGARWWEIAVVDPSGSPEFDGSSRANGVSSAQVVLNPDGSFDITIARDPKPGNWISPGELGRYSVAMSLHLAHPREAFDPGQVLPRITRSSCP
jgi:hypothetical protein